MSTNELESMLASLTQAARTVEPDDLPGLAKVHGWCMQLAKLPSPVKSDVSAELSATLKAQLEELILGDTQDANAALERIRRGVDELVEMISTAEMTRLAVHPPNASATKSDGSVKVPPDLMLDTPGPSAIVDAPETSVPKPNVTATQTNSDAAALPPDVAASAAASVVPVAAAMPDDSFLASLSDEPFAASASTAPALDPAPESFIAEAVPTPASAAHEPFVSEPLRLEPNTRDFVKSFVDESSDHVAAMEAALLGVEESPEDAAKIDELFRPMHTIKGMAGFLNLRDINCMAHEAESILDQARKGQRSITPALIDLIFSVVDLLKQQIACIAEHLAKPKGDVIPQPSVAAMIAKLRSTLASNQVFDPSPGAGPGQAAPVSASTASPAVVPVAANPEAASGGPDAPPAAPSPPALAAPQAAVDEAESGRRAAASAVETSVRIDIAKLDGLIDMVGELVIAQAQMVRAAQALGDAKLTGTAAQVGKLVREVQGVSMSMRMIPIGPTFHKMARLVRDLSNKAGKRVELKISGEETELDRNVIQCISDPLVHMVRNAVDHGIEPPDKRRAAGKPEAGVLHLRAFHHAGRIVIELSDDGRGLDPARLIAKAVERGLLEPGATLPDEKAYELIFAPGFSTAEKITDVSGRGVGMDVVRRNIEQLRGKVDIRSEIGRGTTFAIRLPLTLAIIDGMVVGLGKETYIIPTIAIEQSLRPSREHITTVQRRGELLNLRGRLLPLLQLGRLFNSTDYLDPVENMIVVVNLDGQQLGLVVSDLLGQQQVVIKSLGTKFDRLRGIAGAAILGDGRVGLILEMSGLAALHEAVELEARTRNADVVNGATPGTAGGGKPCSTPLGTGSPAQS